MNTSIRNGLPALLAFAVMLPEAASADGQAVNLVLLRVNDSQTALEYNAAGSNHGSCENPGPGCVRVRGRGEITFRLVNDRRCDSGDQWELSGVQLGGENAAAKPGAWGGLSATAAADFDADPASGWATTTPASGQSITLQDGNSASYTIWYRVSAGCDEGTLWFDPRIENEG